MLRKGTLLTVWLLVGCGGPYGRHGRYANEINDQNTLGSEAYADLASLRDASDYDAISDYTVECVTGTVQAERLKSELDALPSDAYGQRATLRDRTQAAATRCLTTCPRVMRAESAASRDRAMGEKYGARCLAQFDHGALQLDEGERALERATQQLAAKNYLEAREALMDAEVVLKSLAGESSARQTRLGQQVVKLRTANQGVLLKAESFARDPWVVATRGRLRAIASERARLPPGHPHLKELDVEEKDLSTQLFERRTQAGM